MLHLIGETFDDRFRIEKLIGKGGMGAVFLARHLLMDKPVALKVLSRHLSEDDNQVTRFNQEAQNSSRLRHPNTIRVFDFGRAEQGHLYLAMEYLEGLELSKVLKRDAPLPAERAIHILRQIAKSMAEAHNIGLIHRDVKPDNIFLSNVYGERDFVKVLDFGIAKVVNDEDLANLTQTGFICGTPTYLAPEIAMGTSITPATDIYSIGVVAYQMLTGRAPFRADTPIAVVMKHIHDPVPPFAPDHPGPLRLQQLCLEMLSKDPSGRPATADVLLERLDTVLTPSGVGRATLSAPPPLPPGSLQEVSTTQVESVGELGMETMHGEGPLTPEQRNAQTSAIPSPRGVEPQVSAWSGSGRLWVAALTGCAVVAAILAWPGEVPRGEATPAAVVREATEPLPATVKPPKAQPAAPTVVGAEPATMAEVAPEEEPLSIVVLGTVPIGAEVYDGDVRLGVTPMAVEVKAKGGAPRQVTVRLEGHQEQTLVVDGSKAMIEITLERSTVSLKGKKDGARKAKSRATKPRTKPKKGSERTGTRRNRWKDFEAR